MFIAQRLVRPCRQPKQIIQIEHDIVKNPNWLEANQLAIYKRGRGFKLGATVKQIQAQEAQAHDERNFFFTFMQTFSETKPAIKRFFKAFFWKDKEGRV